MEVSVWSMRMIRSTTVGHPKDAFTVASLPKLHLIEYIIYSLMEHSAQTFMGYPIIMGFTLVHCTRHIFPESKLKNMIKIHFPSIIPTQQITLYHSQLPCITKLMFTQNQNLLLLNTLGIVCSNLS